MARIDARVRCSKPQVTTDSTASHTLSQEVWKSSAVSFQETRKPHRGMISLTGQSLSRAGKISSCVNWLSAREKIGPVNEPLTSQSTCLFNRFAPLFGEVTIVRLRE